MANTYWNGNSENAWIAKAVVSGTGHVVPKNYSRNSLRDGDVGLEMRVDRGKLDAMTPEQRLAAQNAGKEMCAGFLQALGVEREAEGFKPGMLIRAHHTRNGAEEIGLLVRITNSTATLQEYADVACTKTKLVQIPLSQFVIEEERTEFSGLDGLLMLTAQVSTFNNDMGVIKDIVSRISNPALIRNLLGEEFQDVLRAAAFQRMTDPTELAEVAKTHEDIFFRCASVDRIDDPHLLAQIALKHDNYDTRLAAVMKITDQPTLVGLAREVKATENVRVEAVKKIKDQHVLVEIGTTRDTISDVVRREAVRRIEDQHVLVEIARTVKAEGTRFVAVQKISDQTVIAEVIEADRCQNNPLRLAAARRITDPAILAELARNSVHDDVQLDVLDRVTDQAVLTDIALATDRLKEIREKALSQITDQRTLAKIAQRRACADRRACDDIRHIAVSKLEDSGLLLKLARKDLIPEIRYAAAVRINDQPTFIELMRSDRVSDVVRRAAVRMINDQPTLVQIAMTDVDAIVRMEAARLIEDQPTLAQIAISDMDYRVRGTATEKINDQPTLVQIAKQNDGNDTGRIAVEKITDPKALVEVVMATRQIAQISAFAKINDWRTLITLSACDDPGMRERANNRMNRIRNAS